MAVVPADVDDDSDLLERCIYGRAGAAEAMLICGAYADQTDDEGDSALYLACERGFLEVARALIKFGASVTFTSPSHDNNTPLHVACLNGHSDVAGYLIDCGAEVDARNAMWSTPLHLACSQGWRTLARFLIGRGANPAAEDESGKTPIDYLNVLPEPIENNVAGLPVSERQLREAFKNLGPNSDGTVELRRIRETYDAFDTLYYGASDDEVFEELLRRRSPLSLDSLGPKGLDKERRRVNYDAFCALMLELAKS
eukprot:RCo005341